MTQRAIAIRLIVACPKCHEEVSLTLTKRDVKEIMRGFKLGINQANIRGDKYLQQSGAWKE